ncbi:MAG: glucose 1-dehydrogenase [Candidatus Bathyarchaeia archaeon]|jgi:NAD(P)-dependent dehydrogenase (short-subunit alcohol dehydrogenase family)
MGKLAGKVAIVTGARQGIGAGIAKVLARHDADVVLTDVSDSVAITAQELLEDGLHATAYQMDVTNAHQIDHVVKQVVDKFGRIDILVNNAGIYPRCELLEMSDDFLCKMFDVNVFGMFRCSRAVLLIMMKQRYGKIVNLSSVTGPLVADPAGGQTAYASTKAAVWGFTTALALEVAQYGINVNCVCPGHIDTPGGRDQTTAPSFPDKSLEELGKTIPMCRVGTPEEVGDLVAFLASDESKYMTGTHVIIDGGNIIQETYRGPYSAK